MANPNSTVQRQARRRFIKKLIATTTGSLALAATVKAKIHLPGRNPPRAQTNKSKGYRETAHILKYYDKARF